jgi:prephenate dehydratase
MPIRSWLLALALVAPWTAPGARAEEIGFLGPRGTYSEQATAAYIKAHPRYDKPVPLPTITAVFEAVVAGKVPIGLVPAENSGTSFPAEFARNVMKGHDPGFRVVGEVTIPIQINLLVKPGTKPGDVKKVLSHPNALKEAQTYLKARFPGVPQEETRSTAAAAEIVAKGEGTLAALAAPAAGRLYALETLAEGVQDDRHNATSFWAIVKADSRALEPGPNRLVVKIEAPAGSRIVSAAIVALAAARFDVVNVNQAPLGGPIHGYRYVFLLGSAEPGSLAAVQAALAAIREPGRALVLGAWRQ